MEYEVGEVYLWKGGECPLPKGTRVHIRLGKSDMSSVSEDWNKLRDATFFSWRHVFSRGNIIMFKVISYPKPEPVKRTVTLELTEEQIEMIEGILSRGDKS